MIAETIVNLLLDAKKGIDPHEFVTDYVTAWKNRFRTPGTFSVGSSYGTLKVDQDGNVVQIIEPQATDDPETRQWLASIKQFDVDEWRRYWREDPVKIGSIDILDLGCWFKNGSYSGPEMDWRADFRQHREHDAAWAAEQ